MFFKRKRDSFVTRGNSNVYNATDVAVYIINYCAERNRPINNLYLQKLLYFVYAFFLVETTEQKHLFKSNMVAWNFGPAFPEVYYSFDHYCCNKIPYLHEYSTLTSIGKKPYIKTLINAKDRELIRYIIDKYSNCSVSEIVFLTQSQSPWFDAWGLSNHGKPITDKSIIEYFKYHRQR